MEAGPGAEAAVGEEAKEEAGIEAVLEIEAETEAGGGAGAEAVLAGGEVEAEATEERGKVLWTAVRRCRLNTSG